MLHPAWNAGCSNAPMIIRLTASPRVPIVVSHPQPSAYGERQCRYPRVHFARHDLRFYDGSQRETRHIRHCVEANRPQS